jgi:hypothetical protein
MIAPSEELPSPSGRGAGGEGLSTLKGMTMRYLAAILLVAMASAAVAEDFSGMRGANYVPSYARNDVQLWMDYDPAVVDREPASGQISFPTAKAWPSESPTP